MSQHRFAASHHVVVLGASPKRERFSNRAVRMLTEYGHRVTPVHPCAAQIEGLACVARLDAIGAPVDTLTLYIGPARSRALQDEIVALAPARVIFNPGTESQPLEQALRTAGIGVVHGCTLVMLESGRFAA